MGVRINTFLILSLFSIILGLAPFTAVAYSTSTWTIQTIDENANGGGLIALDTNNNPHIVFGEHPAGDYNKKAFLIYASWNGSVWIKQNITSQYRLDDFLLDSNNNPHLLLEGAGLFYASWTGSSWSIQKITSEGIDGKLALDSYGNPHVAYIADIDIQHPSVLMYASWIPSPYSKWSFGTVDSSAYFYSGISLAIDSTDNAHIMYEGTSNNIKYAILDNDSGLLKTQTLFNDSVLGPMVLDSTGNPHLLYREEYPQHEFNNSTLYYAYWTGTTWKTQPIVSNIVLSGVGLALDKQDNPHIDYFIPSPGSVFYGSLIYETYTGKTWEIQTLNSNVTSGASMAIDSKGNPHLSYSGSHVYNSYNIAYCMYAMMTTSVTQVDVTSTLDFVLLIAILVIIAVFAFAVHICRKSSRSKNQIIQH